MVSTKNGTKVYQGLARAFDALQNCKKSGNTEWEERHRDKINSIVAEKLPHGSGIVGLKFNEEESKPDRLVFDLSFHHMDQNGFYDGYTDHQIIVTPSLSWGFNLRVTGRNKNEIKEYLGDIIGEALEEEL